MTVTLTPSTEGRLREKAAREGHGLDELADSLQAILDWEDQEPMIASLKRGLEASDAGRVRPLSGFAEVMRAKYNLPVHLSDQDLIDDVTPA